MKTNRVVICPDSFKGTIDAADAAAALAQGWHAQRPDDILTLLPMADGGEGTIDAVAAANPAATREPVTVRGPKGQPVSCEWLRLPDGAGVVEIAATSGLGLSSADHAMAADSRGLGQAIAAALDAGVTKIIVALGGSATSDGGAGALRALGARLLDESGRPVPGGNAGLARLHSVDLSALRPLPRDGVTVLTDVRSPLLGPAGAITVFGPQKGITPADADAAEANLGRYASLMRSELMRRQSSQDIDPATPGAGAAGGAGFGMLAWGAAIASGAESIADLLGVPDAVADSDIVITGEGRYDDQSAQGKVVQIIHDLAAEGQVPVMLVAGAIEGDVSGFARSASLSDLAGDPASAMTEPGRWLTEAGRRLAVHRSADLGHSRTDL